MFPPNDYIQQILEVLRFPDRKNIDLLLADHKQCEALLKADIESQFLRRTYCRSAFAVIEGCIHLVKSATYNFNAGLVAFVDLLAAYGVKLKAPIFSDVVPLGEAALLCERNPEVKSNGDIRQGVRFLDFERNFRFTFVMATRVFKVSCLPDYSKPDWRGLLDAVEVRNRITHPKADASLDISDEELAKIAGALQWTLDRSTDALNGLSASINTALPEMQTIHEEALASIIRGLKTLKDLQAI